MSNRTQSINIFLVYMLLFISGSWRYNLSPEPYLFLVFLLSLSAWFLTTNRKVNHGFLLYTVVFAGFLLIISLYTNGSLSVMAVLSTTMKFVIAYLILVTVGSRFVDTYVWVVVFLAAFSLFGYLSDLYGLFDSVIYKLPPVQDLGFDGIFYLYRFSAHLSRNNSIFFEPGAYQAFLNAALFMLVFTENGFGNRLKWGFIIILTIALATTFSTTGYVIFAFMFGLFLYRSEMISFRGKIVAVGTILGIISVFATQFHSVFVEKIDDYLEADEYDFGYSAQARSAGLQTDLKLLREHVFGLGGKRYSQEFARIGRTTKAGSSNGVTRILAVYGLPFGLFIFCSYYLAFRKLLIDPLLAMGGFVMFILFLWGQSYYSVSPISFAIIAGAFVLSQTSLQQGSSAMRTEEL